jgi:hypothetical protein
VAQGGAECWRFLSNAVTNFGGQLWYAQKQAASLTVVAGIPLVDAKMA